MQATPKSMRLHIGLFGRRNVGKSSVLNALTRQDVAIVSEQAGTTTDPVEKTMEMLPLGPVLFIDTAGIDDIGALGEQRIERTKQVFNRTDIALIITDTPEFNEFENRLLDEFASREIPVIAVFNKSDVNEASAESVKALGEKKIPVVSTVAPDGTGIADLKQALIRTAPDDFVNTPTIVGDLLAPGDLAVLVIPIDTEAPKGRLILPQVQTIRDLLDHDAYAMAVKERELADALGKLKDPPRIVITDSQAFQKVAADVPPDVWLTSFSILFARLKGDLTELVRGTLTIDDLEAGDRILICEACTHHAIGEDIGTVKIPRWLTQYVGGRLEFDHYAGRDFPPDVEKYKLIIHCGGCVHNRREMLSRIAMARAVGIPITNYGLCIAYSLGIFERALEPFPGIREILASSE
jgi:[FeFe] hydrogenase H-cluster maturation GTPase HydF